VKEGILKGDWKKKKKEKRGKEYQNLNLVNGKRKMLLPLEKCKDKRNQKSEKMEFLNLFFEPGCGGERETSHFLCLRNKKVVG